MESDEEDNGANTAQHGWSLGQTACNYVLTQSVTHTHTHTHTYIYIYIYNPFFSCAYLETTEACRLDGVDDVTATTSAQAAIVEIR